MHIDPRTFSFAGTSMDSDGVYKARFANKLDTRPKVMEKLFGYTNVVFVPLPNPMSKLDAIAYLLETKPEGVNVDALCAKAIYINTQIGKIDGTIPKRLRGRPRKNPLVITSPVVAPNSIVNTIVNAVREDTNHKTLTSN